MQANKAIRGFNCSFILESAMVRINQLELCLFSVFSKGVAALELLQSPDRQIEV